MITKLQNLYELQLLDDQLDELAELRGDLPAAVNELKEQMQVIKNQMDSKIEEKENSLALREKNEEEVELLENNLKKFKAQLYQVRNNKEYDALTKEIDHSEDKIKTLENDNVALEELVEKLKIEIEELTPELEEFQLQLDEKEEELKTIVKANEREESKFQVDRDKIVEKIKRNDYNTYMRIRKARHGKAVATVERAACAGCHNVVPPQRQIEIRQNKRIYTCEFCGRILISKEVSDNVKGS
ncbi:MAG: hypothetical protein K9J12_05025 [Melioribacteraceae bacterium]|nr:hypothetical protein [Melioribacteraceae bacterium]MCF8262937.1 hypothetical protein [Melioribacteraceae bacterium]MCF8413118.1 hypothetical protein [Melioribacteraceae bacterium]